MESNGHPQIFVPLSPDVEGRVAELQILELPDLDGINVLQYFVNIYQGQITYSTTIHALINVLNPNLVVTGYEYNELQQMIYFRYNQPFQVQEEITGTIEWIVQMIDFQVSRFLPFFVQALEGTSIEKINLGLAQSMLEWANGE